MCTHPFQSLPIYQIPLPTLAIRSGTKAARCWIIAETTQLDDPANIALLKKILEAVSIGWDKEVCLLNLTVPKTTGFYQLLPEGSSKTILIFGITPKALGLQIVDQPYKVLKLRTHTYLFSATLSEIAKDQEHKKKLWSSLRNLFSL